MRKITNTARTLRRDLTDAEKKLWQRLRNSQLGVKFRRQHPEPPYILDFYCEKKKLAIEVDGGQHSEEVDKERTEFLQKRRIKIIRFWNNEVLSNIEGVLHQIIAEIGSPSPSHAYAWAPPSPDGRGKNDAAQNSLSQREREGPAQREGEGLPQHRRLLAGKITTAHGVRGLVKVQVFAEDATLLNGTLYTSADSENTLTITLKNQLGGKADNLWLASVDGITDRTAAEPLRGRELWIERDQLAAPDQNEYYVSDLIGLPVRDATGNNIGTVRALDNFGAGDLLDIAPPTGESFYLPFTADHIISVEGGVITVALPEETP